MDKIDYISRKAIRESFLSVSKKCPQLGADAIKEMQEQISKFLERAAKESLKSCAFREGKRLEQKDVRFAFENILKQCK